MATYISNIPTINVDPKIQENHQLRDQNIQLKDEIRTLEEHIQYLTRLLENNECFSCKNRSTSKKIETEVASMKNVSEISESDEPKGLA